MLVLREAREAMESGPVFCNLIKAAIEGFMNSYKDIMSIKSVNDLFTQLGKNDSRSQVIYEAKKLGTKKIYTDPKKVEIELGSFSILSTLLDDFIKASIANSKFILQNNPDKSLDWKSKLVTDLLQDHKPNNDNAHLGKSGMITYAVVVL